MSGDTGNKSQAVEAGKLVAAYNKFGLKLCAQVASDEADRNILISPSGIAFSLAMAHLGAAGDTRRAIAKVLELKAMGPEEIDRGTAELLNSLDRSESKLQLAIASALWANKNIHFAPAFLQKIREFYAAEAASVDFTDSAALVKINEWARRRTNGKIDAILSPAELKPATACVLTNAVYLKGLWTAPFDKQATRDGAFSLPGGRQQSVPLMSQTAKHAYFQDAKFQAVNLPYADGKMSMYVFLPAENSSLPAFLKTLNPDRLEKWIAGLELRQVQLVLPRFKLMYEADVVGPLIELGMGAAFRDGADFTPMGLGSNYITTIKHKAMAEVNEEGTEAAATTTLLMGRSLMGPPRMVVNRPFFWTIRDNVNGLILFAGAVVDPSEEQ